MEQTKKNDVLKPYLSLSETCEYLSLSKACIYSWTSKKINLPFHKIGKKLLLKVSDLDEFIEKNRIKPKHEIDPEN
ncbi:MAG: helix-turn-helix domain-containing protein [Candidatus Cloacimonetes bacterium]|jgi:excisionase family DNA binding protein|nr:helix-turn-helix domain-containing protein [Candidatus Cloacimonadota bacterium]